jgi:hypothetical protein
MVDTQEKEIIHKLLLARELRRQGPSWNRAFRRELWRLLMKSSTPYPRTPNRRKPDRS